MHINSSKKSLSKTMQKSNTSSIGSYTKKVDSFGGGDLTKFDHDKIQDVSLNLIENVKINVGSYDENQA